MVLTESWTLRTIDIINAQLPDGGEEHIHFKDYRNMSINMPAFKVTSRLKKRAYHIERSRMFVAMCDKGCQTSWLNMHEKDGHIHCQSRVTPSVCRKKC